MAPKRRRTLQELMLDKNDTRTVIPLMLDENGNLVEAEPEERSETEAQMQARVFVHALKAADLKPAVLPPYAPAPPFSPEMERLLGASYLWSFHRIPTPGDIAMIQTVAADGFAPTASATSPCS